MRVDEQRIEEYLRTRFGPGARLLGYAPLGELQDPDALKGYGYGAPVRLDFIIGTERRSAVLETVSPGPFGHEHMEDRAQIVLWSHRTFGRLPRHSRSLDAGGFRRDGALVSLGDVEELFMLNEFIEGREYVHDLEHIRDTGALADLDLARSDALCDYLAAIHGRRGGDPGLYIRRARELVGHGECLMGIVDSYPAGQGRFSASRLEDIERSCIAWRWRLKQRAERSCQVHGDFHPWNLLFRDGTDFSVLDRARGEWGEAADDVTCLSLNYVFFALQQSGRFQGPFEVLFRRFWDRYLEATGDDALLEVAAPFLAFRGLVMANPVWYPHLPDAVREQLLHLVERVLSEPVFDPGSMPAYLRG